MNLINLFNEDRIDWAIGLLVEAHHLEQNGDVYSMNLGKKSGLMPIFTVDGGKLVMEEKIPSGIRLGGYKDCTPFDVMVEYECKGSVGAALTRLRIIYGEDSDYLRIGSDYFKTISQKDYFGFEREIVVPWAKTEIKQDLGNDFMKTIKTYDGFTNNPMNLDYKRSVGNFYNSYSPIPHIPVPCSDPSEIPWSMKMVKHIFRDKWELGLKYMQCMFLHPKQMLPIPCLVSSLNQTGKSTFINWNVSIYGTNATILSVDELGGTFNSHYAGKLLIGIEETKSDDLKVLNKIKQLSTAKQISVNTKGIRQYDQDFYGKFIFTSNHKNTFLKIDDDDIRYWVLEIQQIQGENHNIENDLKEEIPKFLGYLQQLPPIEFGKSRQVFTDEEISTEIKNDVQGMSHSALYLEIRQILKDYFKDNIGTRKVSFTLADIHKELAHNPTFNKNKFGKWEIKNVLIEEMKLEIGRAGQYIQCFGEEQSILGTTKKFNPHYTVKIDTFKDAEWKESLRRSNDDIADAIYDVIDGADDTPF